MTHRNVIWSLLFLSLLSTSIIPCHAQDQTVGLFVNELDAYQGYTLFAPIGWTTTYLIDMEGRLVHSWESGYTPGNSVYLLENGNLLKTCMQGNQRFTAGGNGGRIQETEWDGTLVWNYQYSGPLRCQHHDIEYLPNGNVLMIAWEFKTRQEAILAGRDPSLVSEDGLWPDTIVEVSPSGLEGGTVVWEWHVWDHLIQDFDASKDNYGVVADNPELIDINFSSNPAPDWNHTNGIDYNAEFDQIIVSVRAFSEFWVIDHSTTTAEAAGHTGGSSGLGGDLLYRWGNPRAYGRGTVEDQRLYVQHDVTWIPEGTPGEGNILVFNNGEDRPGGNYSSVDEIQPPVDGSGHYTLVSGEAFGPAEAAWSYSSTPPSEFYSSHISGAQRLPSGNTLICEGASGTFFEVTQSKNVVWEYVNPVTRDGPLTQGDPLVGEDNQVFRCYRYGTDYPAFDGKDLSPGDPIENEPTSVSGVDRGVPASFTLSQNYPNPFNPETTIRFALSEVNKVELRVFNTLGKEIRVLVNDTRATGEYSVVWDGRDARGQRVGSGIYFYTLRVGATVLKKKMVIAN